MPLKRNATEQTLRFVRCATDQMEIVTSLMALLETLARIDAHEGSLVADGNLRETERLAEEIVRRWSELDEQQERERRQAAEAAVIQTVADATHDTSNQSTGAGVTLANAVRQTRRETRKGQGQP